MSGMTIWAIWCGCWAIFWFQGAFWKYEPEPVAYVTLSVFAAILGIVPLLAVTAHAKTERSQQVTRDFQMANPCPSTGKPTGACPGWIKDHIIPLCKGGPDAVSNLQWQTTEDAKAKDRWECK